MYRSCLSPRNHPGEKESQSKPAESALDCWLTVWQLNRLSSMTTDDKDDSVFLLLYESPKRELAEASWIDPRSIDRMIADEKGDSVVSLLYESPMSERARRSHLNRPRSIDRMTADDKDDSVFLLLYESPMRESQPKPAESTLDRLTVWQLTTRMIRCFYCSMNRPPVEASWIDPRSIHRMIAEGKGDSVVSLLYESPMRES